jgi:hypothetical protein
MKIFRIVFTILATILSVYVLVTVGVGYGAFYFIFPLLATFQIFGTKNHKTVYLVLKIIILLFAAIMFFINLADISQESLALVDTVFWAISFVAFIVEPPTQAKLERKENKAIQKKSRLSTWLNSLHSKPWLISWTASLLIFIITFVLAFLKVGLVNGQASVWENWIFDISTIIFLVSLSVWLILRFRKWSIFFILGLILIIIGINSFVKRYSTNNSNNLLNPTSAPLPTVNWSEFDSPDGKFKFMYPQNFVFTKTFTTVGNPAIVYDFSSPQKDSAGTSLVDYEVLVGVYPSGSDPSLMLAMPNFMDLVTPLDSSTSGKIMSHGLSNFGKYTAFEYRAQVSGAYWVRKYIAVKQTLYDVDAYYASEGFYNEEDYNKFVNSFIIIKE